MGHHARIVAFVEVEVEVLLAVDGSRHSFPQVAVEVEVVVATDVRHLMVLCLEQNFQYVLDIVHHKAAGILVVAVVLRSRTDLVG